ncbi:MAG: D-glycero-beta-D-manno-heptose 1-phosphate adenylyltransferase [Pseudomonadota bacterium]
MAGLFVGCAQFEVQEGWPKTNLSVALDAIRRLAQRGAGLVLLPEMFSTGFHYEGLAGLATGTPAILGRLREEAARLGVAICGSMPEPEEGRIFNTSYLIDERGELAAAYRKVHLFSPTGEPRHFAAGDTAVVGVAAGLRLGLLTCYDLRFPELARALCLAGAQALCVVAQWPAARAAHWRLLTRARALENQLYLVACNGCGSTAGGLDLAGGSVVVSPQGEVLAEAGTRAEEILAPLEPDRTEEFRRLLPALAERRPQAYRHVEKGPARGLKNPAAKVMSIEDCAPRLAAIRAGGGRIVFTNGCFDLLHVGHVRYLALARCLGDCLVVGMNTDGSVRALKGDTRPLVPEERRSEVLAALEVVDFVIPFSELTPERLICLIQPDVLVKGADWRPEAVVGREIIEARGGRVVLIDTTPGASTTALIEAVRSRSSA